MQFGGSELFGREKDKSFESSARTIYQSFGGQDMYPSVEEKAANLLYFVTSGLRLFYSCIFSTATAASTGPTARGASPTTRS